MGGTVARLIGGAGTGKTKALLDLMSKAVDEIGDPHEIGFVSFTRAARREAAERAAEQFDLTPKQLEQDGWFRTIHSVAYRCLGCKTGDLITDTAEDRQWVQTAVQEEIHGATPAIGEEPFAEPTGDADRALSLWSTARNRLVPLREVWDESDEADPRTPDYPTVAATVERYEQAKRLDGRLDYVDLLGRFAGYRFDVDGAQPCEPDGEAPSIEVWFFDEQQDASALLDAVCKRLVEPCRWAYVVGDPFQSIYGWAGADPSFFLGWPVAKQKTMPKSWRCPAPVLALGERILEKCPDYWDRGIQPADHPGTVEDCPLGEDFTDMLDPREPWLLLARTNYLARRLGGVLDAAGVPWKPARGMGGWNAPVRNEAIRALYAAENGSPIDGAQWQSVLKQLPSTHDGETFLARGTKTEWADMSRDEAEDRAPFVLDLSELGATPALVQLIREKRWRSFVPTASECITAIQRWGEEALSTPQIEIGTIHSAKGRECDNVAVLTTLSGPCFRHAQSPRGKAEEQRVFYVAVTRAKRRLVIVDEVKPQFRKTLPLYQSTSILTP